MCYIFFVFRSFKEAVQQTKACNGGTIQPKLFLVCNTFLISLKTRFVIDKKLNEIVVNVKSICNECATWNRHLEEGDIFLTLICDAGKT